MEDYQIVNDFSNVGEALDVILAEHKDLKKKHWNLQYISQTVAETVNKRIYNELKRVRLRTNNTDRKIQILIELLQGYVQHIPTSDMYKPELFHTEEIVRNRITKMK